MRAIKSALREKYLEGIVWLTAPLRELNKFFKSNRHLFTIIGVFSALSAYISGIEREAPTAFYEVSVFAGFGIVVLASVVLLHNLWRQTIQGDRNAGQYRNWGLLIFGSIYVPLLVVLSGLLSTFRGYLSMYYVIGGWFFGVVLSLMYFSALGSILNWADSKSDNLASAIAGIGLFLPPALLVYSDNRDLVYTEVESLLGGGPPELWLKYLFGTFLAWSSLVALIAIFLLFIVVAVIVVAWTTLLLFERFVALPLARSLVSEETPEKLREYRKRVMEYNELNYND